MHFRHPWSLLTKNKLFIAYRKMLKMPKMPILTPSQKARFWSIMTMDDENALFLASFRMTRDRNGKILKVH